MWNSTDHGIRVRTLLYVVYGALIAGVVVLVIVMTLALKPKNTQVSQQNTTATQPQIDDTTPFTPVNELSILIKPCYFVATNNCNKDNAVITSEPDGEIDKNQNTGEEAVARKDIFTTISQVPNKGLISYQVQLTADQVSKYFPEYFEDSKIQPVTLPAPFIIARMAAKYGVNHRVLLILMEVLHRGAGPFLSNSSNYSAPYFTEKPDFLEQVATVAQSLQTNKTKYELQKIDQKQLPDIVTFLDKKYRVNAKTNAESLALIDFLSTQLKNKKEFEQVIYAPDSLSDSTINKTMNFLYFYQLFFKVDPRL